MKRGLLVAIIATLIVSLNAVAASAHPGDLWFQSAYTQADNIERKYPRVDAARCWPLPVWARSQYNAHSWVRGTVRLWDHFLCGVYSNYSDGVCFAVAHITGKEWNAFNLSTWRSDGCTPWQLRG